VVVVVVDLINLYSRLLRNVSTLTPNYTASHSTRR
jgi:hypothetical protein